MPPTKPFIRVTSRLPCICNLRKQRNKLCLRDTESNRFYTIAFIASYNYIDICLVFNYTATCFIWYDAMLIIFYKQAPFCDFKGSGPTLQKTFSILGFVWLWRRLENEQLVSFWPYISPGVYILTVVRLKHLLANHLSMICVMIGDVILRACGRAWEP